MGFGLTNAPATFSRVLNLILRGLTWKTILAFLDDILVMGKTFEEHLQNLVEALERFRIHGMKLKPKKCQTFKIKSGVGGGRGGGGGGGGAGGSVVITCPLLME